MRTNDQYFVPGDKVMKVCGAPHNPSGSKKPPKPVRWGEVYCVEDFYEGPQFNAIMLVGFGGWQVHTNGVLIGFPASCFRKVDEIRLCVAATQHAVQPEHQEV